MKALDNSMRDIMSQPGLPFGGKTVVFGGILDKSSLLCVRGRGLR